MESQALWLWGSQLGTIRHHSWWRSHYLHCPWSLSPTSKLPHASSPQTPKIDMHSYGVLVGEVVTQEIPDPDKLQEEMVQQVWRQWPQIHPLNYHVLHWIQPRWSPHHGLYTWQVWETNSLNRVLRQLLFNFTKVLQNVTTCLIQLGYFMRVPIKFLVVFKKVTLCHLRIPNYIFRDFGVTCTLYLEYLYSYFGLR